MTGEKAHHIPLYLVAVGDLGLCIFPDNIHVQVPSKTFTFQISKPFGIVYNKPDLLIITIHYKQQFRVTNSI